MHKHGRSNRFKKQERSGRAQDLTISVACGACGRDSGGGGFSSRARGWELRVKGRVYKGGSSFPFNFGETLAGGRMDSVLALGWMAKIGLSVLLKNGPSSVLVG